MKTPNQNGKTLWGDPEEYPPPAYERPMETPREFPEMTLEERWEIWGPCIEQEQKKLRESNKDLEKYLS